jgi:hypothetical protein
MWTMTRRMKGQRGFIASCRPLPWASERQQQQRELWDLWDPHRLHTQAMPEQMVEQL